MVPTKSRRLTLLGHAFFVLLCISCAAAPRTTDTTAEPPYASAGEDQTAVIGTIVHLRAEANDLPRIGFTYEWVLLSRPDLSYAVIGTPFSNNATLKIDQDGLYVVGLHVTNAQGDRAFDLALINGTTGVDETPAVLNRAPVAIAGDDRVVVPGTTVLLDGSKSYDPDGAGLAQSWTLVSRPEGSNGALVRPDTAVPALLTDRPGAYVLSLIVSDGVTQSAADHIVITADVAPSARLYAPTQTLAGDLVALDAEGSSDLEPGPLGYTWQLVQRPALSQATLVAGSSDGTRALQTDRVGDYVVQVVVSDGTSSVAASATIHARSLGEVRPIAGATPTIFAMPGVQVWLGGSQSSDPLGGALTYEWTVVSVPAPSANGTWSAIGANPPYTPDVPGHHIVQLVVRNAVAVSAPFTVLVVCNTPPVASAGPDALATKGVSVALDGRGSNDPDGDSLTYTWSIISRPLGSVASIGSSSMALASFVPDVAGLYTIRLGVADAVTTRFDSLVLDVNALPIARAGSDQGGMLGAPAPLDGSASSDTAGDVLTFAWTIEAAPPGSAASIAAPDQMVTSFAPDVVGIYRLRLTATDQRGGIGVDALYLIVAPPFDAACSTDALFGTAYGMLGGRSNTIFEPLCNGWMATFETATNIMRVENVVTGEVARAIQLSAAASALRIDRATGHAFVALGVATFYSDIDLVAGTLVTLPLARAIFAIQPAEDDKLFVIESDPVATTSRRVSALQASTGTLLSSTPALDSGIARLGYAPVSDRVFVFGDTSGARRFVFDPATGVVASSAEQTLSGVTGSALSVDGTRVALTAASVVDRAALNFSIVYGAVSGTLPEYSDDGAYLATVSGTQIRIYTTATHAFLKQLTPSCPSSSVSAIRRVAFSRGGHLVHAGVSCVGGTEALSWMTFD